VDPRTLYLRSPAVIQSIEGTVDMNCANCGSELLPTSAYCHACGRAVSRTGPTPSTTPGLDHLVADASRAARELAEAAGRLATKAAEKADRAAHDPGASAQRALKRVQDELDRARVEIEKTLKEL
jgi:hypothetical protein